MKEHEFMSQVRRISMAGCLWLALLSSPAQEVVTTKTCFPVNQPIPDGSVVGMADQRTIALPGPFSITDLKVSVTVAGGFNGDVYCYLRHESGFVVLLNRPGRCATNSMGYEDTGFKATFSASATNDFHRYRECSGLPCDLAADWAPDGREADPRVCLESSPRVTSLNSFVGLDPNGQWTLYVADLSNGGEATLVDWSLAITAKADSSVREPQPGSPGVLARLVQHPSYRLLSLAKLEAR